jgi:5'-nucleotidase
MKSILPTALALIALLAVPAAAPAAKPQKRDTHVQLLAINDLHGHLAPNTPGTVQTGCCNPVFTNGAQTGWTQKTVPAGGIAYLATHIKSLRRGTPRPSRWAPAT